MKEKFKLFPKTEMPLDCAEFCVTAEKTQGVGQGAMGTGTVDEGRGGEIPRKYYYL